MKIHCLFLQRPERYEGENAPELLAAVDEFTMEENSEWFTEQCEREIGNIGRDAGTFKVIVLEVSLDKLCSLMKSDPSLPAQIVGSD